MDDNWPGEGGGGFLTKFNTGSLQPKVKPLTFYRAFWQKRHPFYIPFIEKRYPFHIPTLEHCNPFLSPCNKVTGNEKYYGHYQVLPEEIFML